MITMKLQGALPDAYAEPAWDVALLFPAQGAWTEGEYLQLNTNHLVEFSHGQVEVLPTPTRIHQMIVGYLYLLFRTFAKHEAGIVVLAPFRLRLWEGKYREPDLLFLANKNDPRNQEAFWLGADLVVEVVSLDDPNRDLVEKRREYAQAGIPEYWIVNPQAESITVLQLRHGYYIEHGLFKRGDTATSATLAGIEVDVAAVLDVE